MSFYESHRIRPQCSNPHCKSPLSNVFLLTVRPVVAQCVERLQHFNRAAVQNFNVAVSFPSGPCGSLGCHSLLLLLVVPRIISMMMLSRMLIICCLYPAFFLKSVDCAQHLYNLMCENAFVAPHILCNTTKNLLYLQKCPMIWIRDLQTR